MAEVKGLTQYGGPFRQTHVVPKPVPTWDNKPFKKAAVGPKPQLKTGITNLAMAKNGATTRDENPTDTDKTQIKAKVPASVYQQVISARKRKRKDTNTLSPKQV